jgi:hypothetical protein
MDSSAALNHLLRQGLMLRRKQARRDEHEATSLQLDCADDQVRVHDS